MAKLRPVGDQSSAFVSPWSVKVKIGVMVWAMVWAVLFLPTPNPLNRWRIFLLKLFGAKISGRPFVASSVKIRMPWKLEMKDRACLGNKVEVYNLDQITLCERTTIAQETYLCTGSHELSTPMLPVVAAPIVIEPDVFVGVRALILPGVTLRRACVVGAGAVVAKDVGELDIVVGNPAKVVKKRVFTSPETATPTPGV